MEYVLVRIKMLQHFLSAAFSCIPLFSCCSFVPVSAFPFPCTPLLLGGSSFSIPPSLPHPFTPPLSLSALPQSTPPNTEICLPNILIKSMLANSMNYPIYNYCFGTSSLSL